jgi:glycosyltransferase involved in cell wall biosynthesis
VVAESLALGTPVVCALHSDNESSDLVGPATGSLVPAFDAQSLADAAEYWLNDDSRRSDRVSAFLSEHTELTANALSASYADILRAVA